MPRRILLTQLRRIGDVLMTTPAVAAVRQAFPDAHVTYLTERPSHQLFAHSPHVDEVLVYPKGLGARLALARTLRRRRFDVAVDFFGNPRSALFTRLTGARRRIGWAFPGRAYAYTDALPLPGLHQYAALDKAALLAPLGVDVADPRPQLFLGDAERAYAERQLAELGVQPGELLVAVCPVSRQPYKVWPAKHFARAADILVERYAARVLFFWGPGEEHFVDAVRLEMHHQALPTYPVPDLLQAAALLERAHLYVGNDNGPRHFAVAVGTPTVTVFGRPHPENWTPPQAPLHRTVAYDPGCKAACTYPRCAHLNCINAVPYDAVEAEMESLLEVVLKDGTPH